MPFQNMMSELSLAHDTHFIATIILKFCTEHGNTCHSRMYSAKFRNDWAIEKYVTMRFRDIWVQVSVELHMPHPYPCAYPHICGMKHFENTKSIRICDINNWNMILHYFFSFLFFFFFKYEHYFETTYGSSYDRQRQGVPETLHHLKGNASYISDNTAVR